MGGGGARSAPLGVFKSPKNGCAQRTGAHARPKPTSISIKGANQLSIVYDIASKK